MNASMIRVLIVDDHLIVRNGLVRMIGFGEGIEVVAEAETGAQAIALFRQHRPDVTLMDLRLPDMSGVDAIIAIRREFPNARIIIVTTYDTDEDIFLGLQSGAKGYLLKDTNMNELLSTIRTVHAGQNYIPPEVGAKLTERLSRPQLTDRERDVLRLIAKGKTNLEIADDLKITESTTKYHVNNILSKLGVSDRTNAVLEALRRGIVSLE